MDKKANLNLLQSGAIAIGIAIITITVMISLNATLGGSFNDGVNTSHLFVQNCESAECGAGGCNWTCTSAEWNASDAGTTGLETFTSYYAVIAIVLVLVILIGMFAYFRGGGKGMNVDFQ